MSEESKPESGITDLAGVKPFAKSFEILTQASVDAASEFLGKLCMPATKELGLWAKDKIHAWRTANIVSVARNTENKMKENGTSDGFHAHPRIAHTIIEQASWTDDASVQDLWAGLLSSSCTKDGDDDSNLIFSNMLANMTKLQARIFKYASESAVKGTKNGLIVAHELEINLEELSRISGENDIGRLDREVDCLRNIGLLTVTSGLRARAITT